MTDEQYQKLLATLEEIRDLTKLRNEKLDALRETMGQKIDTGISDAKQRQEAFRAQQRRHSFIVLGIVLVAGGLFVWWASRPSPADLSLGSPIKGSDQDKKFPRIGFHSPSVASR